MENKKREQKLLERILKIKYPKGPICKKCGGKEFYKRKNPLTIICKDCRYEESAIANTAFHGLRIPVVKAMQILFTIQETYIEFRNLFSSYSLGDEDEVIDEEIDEEKVGKLESDALKKAGPARLSLQEISIQCEIPKKTAKAFIEKIGSWMPKKYSRAPDAYDKWFQGLKSSRSIKIYAALFNLLFDENQKPRSEDDILYTFVKRRVGSEKFLEAW